MYRGSCPTIVLMSLFMALWASDAEVGGRKQRSVPFKTLYNHDGWCVYGLPSPYWDGTGAAPIEQVHGFVDEAADAGMDALLLCPGIFQLPGWDSDFAPYWRDQGREADFGDSGIGVILERVRDFILDGNDLIALTQRRAKERGMAFFLSWRMNDVQHCYHPNSPSQSPFWRNHPELRIGGAEVPVDGEARRMPLIALDFTHEEVRDYKLGAIAELIARYDIDGFELDFLRMPYFFPKNVPFGEKAPHITDFVREVRRLLDAKEPGLPLSVRIANQERINTALGLDVATWVEEGLVDMLNLSAFLPTQPDGDMESYREQFPDVKLYGEITNTVNYLRLAPPDDGPGAPKRDRRHSSRETIHATAHSFLERGADGISVYNYVYTRGHRIEPDFEALEHVADAAYLSKQEKHYFITQYSGGGQKWSSQLPVTLHANPTAEDAVARFVAIHVADESPAEQFSRGVLRVFSPREELLDAPIGASHDGIPLRHIVFERELSVPKVTVEGLHPLAHYRDFEVSLERLERGWNYFELRLLEGEPVTIERVELGLLK